MSTQFKKTPKSPNDFYWAPQKGPQYAFHQASVFELLFGGAAGGSKSESLLFEAIRLCQQYPGYRAILFRRTFPEIEKSLVPRVAEVLGGVCNSRNKGLEWNFSNKSIFYLSHLQREDDKEKHKSAEYDYIGFDELTSFTESMYIYLFSRCRGASEVERFIRAGTNPTGIGHGWVKKRFIDVDLNENKVIGRVSYDFAYGWQVDGHVYTNFSELPVDYAKGNPIFSQETYNIYQEKQSGLTRAFIPSLLWGNAILLKVDPSYVNRLRTLPFKLQNALLYGKWDILEGQFFAEWDPDNHVIDGFDIPDSWKRFVAIDYGFTAPMCALWFAVDDNGKVYVYRELYGARMSTQDQAQNILDMTGDEKIDWYTCDPAMFQRTGSGESHADIYSRHDIPIIGSSNKRIPGWAILHEYLINKQIVVFRNCKNLINTLPTLMHSKTNPEDLDTMQEDHAADCLRYFLLTLRGYRTNVSFVDDGIPEWFKKIRKESQRKKVLTSVRLG